MQRVLITGANGFIGKNLNVALKERNFSVMTFVHGDNLSELTDKVVAADIIYHLAGVNRPLTDNEFVSANTGFTEILVKIIVERNPNVSLIYTSSKQAEKNNPYGKSKLNAEKIILDAIEKSNIKAAIYRLHGVFGKWCRPNYNSVVATFCHNVINDIPLVISDPLFNLELVYIDDVIDAFINHLDIIDNDNLFFYISTQYKISLEELANKIKGFKSSRNTLMIDSVGTDITRALYATYLSYLPPEKFSYAVPVYEDLRGSFAELLKTPSHGQFSFFTAKPGIIRGGHYHHTKNEKFIVVSGQALFRFEHIITHQVIEFEKNSSHIEIVETIPGWAHNIKNIGSEDLIVMLWANEIFDRSKPDTIAWDMLHEK
ncbi:polysaccharide biosynthesis C-terminal domain-containing protein [Yersinia pekkanenii]|uniref:Thermophilic glucose-6-phosphate isomerase and related metalloenzymes n=1 Tax=Yersinia pekkanenii TaxID=1288385 RepID=A0A0T9NJ64_9GAMM|nr:NAD-dependent epimerase/dehydratase family protein [Yersinia pekkanenii]CNH13013.1 Thermophilic glucose-6-phosphate isomerase and related metalloenzymes [Yersinia pekkanenii]CRY65426.1 Thermophilic glucose-6-phosphate isomerase and related metalloenzymes [Yersinia pekkanenii]